MNALAVKGLCKRYPAFSLENVSFSVPEGAVMGFIGRNGAGKSTTLKALLGLVHPDAGVVTVLGKSFREEEQSIKERIGADGQRSVLFSTHITSDLEKCASHITFIKDGTIQHTGTLADFRQHYDYLRQPGQELTLEDIIVSVERRPLDENAII